MFNGARWQMRRWQRNEDYFWSDEAVHFYPEFKVASFEDGLRFAFEVAPRLCLELNGGKLPFGCHAWPRYDRGVLGTPPAQVAGQTSKKQGEMKRALITGITGQDGSYLAELLLGEGL